MGQEHGWTDHGRQVFDPDRLKNAAADLQARNDAQQLRDMLRGALIPEEAFGRIPGGPAAAARLHAAYEALKVELDKVGIDLTDLALRTLAAAQAAAEVDPVTQAAARRAAARIE
jgi:hypothetical protein